MFTVSAQSSWKITKVLIARCGARTHDPERVSSSTDWANRAFAANSMFQNFPHVLCSPNHKNLWQSLAAASSSFAEQISKSVKYNWDVIIVGWKVNPIPHQDGSKLAIHCNSCLSPTGLKLCLKHMARGERKLCKTVATLHYAFPCPPKNERQIAVTCWHLVKIEGNSMVDTLQVYNH